MMPAKMAARCPNGTGHVDSLPRGDLIHGYGFSQDEHGVDCPSDAESTLREVIRSIVIGRENPSELLGEVDALCFAGVLDWGFSALVEPDPETLDPPPVTRRGFGWLS